MRAGTASGIQIAFFTFACMLLAVPVGRWIVHLNDWSSQQAAFILKLLPLMMLTAALIVVPSLRRWSASELRVAIPEKRRREVILVSVVKPIMAFAGIGGLIL